MAAKSLEEMLRLNFDLRTLAQLVLAYAKFDLNKVFDKIIECYFTTYIVFVFKSKKLSGKRDSTLEEHLGV